MGGTRTRRALAHPATGVLRDCDFRDGMFIASSAAYLPAGRTRLTIKLRFSPYSVRNRRLAITLRRFKVFTASSGSPNYTPTPGSDFELYWYLHRENQTITDGTITAANQRIPISRPQTLTFDEKALTDAGMQPGEPSYDRTAFLALYWGNTGYVFDHAAEDDLEHTRFDISRLDQEIRV